MNQNRSARWICAGFVTLVLLTLLSLSALAEPLSVWVFQHTDEIGINAGLDTFRQANPGTDVEINVISGSTTEYMEKLQIAIATDVAPSVAWISGGEVKEFAARGLLTDVTRTLEGYTFNPGDTGEATYDGKLWASPYRTVVRGLFKNVDAFGQSGLDPSEDPATLEELEEWSMRMTRTNNDGSYARVGFVPWEGNWYAAGWMWAFGGELVDESGTRPTANDPKNLAAFEWMAEWGKRFDGTLWPVARWQESFANGSLGMVAHANVTIPRFLDQGVAFTTGRVPHASGGRNGTWGGGGGFVVPHNAPNKDAALRFLRHLGSAETQEAWFDATVASNSALQAQLPANTAAWGGLAERLPVEYHPLLEQLGEINARTPLWVAYLVQQLIPATNAVVTGAKTPSQALDDVQQHMLARFEELFPES